MCGVKELNKVFIGTIPEYGMLGGVLAEYDIAADKLEVHRDVIPKQSIVSLCYTGGLIVGGASIWGGLGQEPSERSAKLFVWELVKHKKVFEATPVENAPAVTGLFVGPDKYVWGLADGNLIVFDPAARKVISRKKLFDIDKTKGHTWRDAFFALHPSGRIYGTSGGKLFELDPETKDMKFLRESGANLLSMDREGRIYFADKAHLCQYTP